MDIAVIGSGIAGLSAAWLLARRHRVTLYEAAPRLGGHNNTVVAAGMPVDTGFIVYNERSYPNLVALFAHLGVPTQATDMSFAVSRGAIRGKAAELEYAGTDLFGLFAQKSNLLRPQFWGMLGDLLRFYRATRDNNALLADDTTTLGDYLDAQGYGAGFQRDHILPMVAAIWSTPSALARDYPLSAFVRFCANHGLLQITGRPVWRTVTGGSIDYVTRLAAPLAGRLRLHTPVRAVVRDGTGVTLHSAHGQPARYDHVVIATHADTALAMLDAPSPSETALLGAFGYTQNQAVLHHDASLMPRRRGVWAAWNFIGGDDLGSPCVTYWMNRLQGLDPATPLFLTLNPPREPARVLHRETYAHPLFDAAAIRAQRALWSLQGHGRTWFCGAHFGAGFHEDGLQSGLAVAEALGGVRRPWSVADESGRIHLGPPAMLAA
ncbi:MAG: NAD/FAD-binding protein [Acetobacteraceae bacterium SCN 69-10]|nr:MAG: NAD/FAD-binding protein [Acetobacteraceae bacterium SCN 69-10]